VATDIIASVVGTVDDVILGPKVVLPDQTAHLIAVNSELEAHFVCALMNCLETRFVYKALLYKHPSTFFLQYVAVPQFDAGNSIHIQLAELSQQAHQLAAHQTSEVSETSEVSKRLAEVEAQVDQAAAELWGITDKELQEIRRSLEELG
jgi:hypothetical protein